MGCDIFMNDLDAPRFPMYIGSGNIGSGSVICQVSGCPNKATVRCDYGFRYCDSHKYHDHTDMNKTKRAYLRSINEKGEFGRSQRTDKAIKDLDEFIRGEKE